MTTATPEAPTSAAAAPADPTPHSRTARRLIVLLVFLIALMLIGYSSGMFKPRPKVALVTASHFVEFLTLPAYNGLE